MGMKGKKILAVTLSLVMLLSVTSYSVSAEEDPVNVSEWEEYDKDKILNDPFAQRLLKNIELSKQRITELQNQQRVLTEHELFIEQQRQIANAQLQEELDRMNKNYADKTPRAAFAKFVSQYPERYHDYYWSLFNYMYSKVEIAREQRDMVIANGGTRAEAQQVFIEHAKMTKSERINYALAMVDKYELYNKISSVKDFNNLPQYTKIAFINYMDKRGLAEYVVKPMFDKDPNDPTQETQIRIIDVKPTLVKPQPTVTQTESLSVASYELNSVEQVIELSAPESDDLIKFTIDEPTSLTRMDFDGNNYKVNGLDTMDDVSELTLSAWVKPNYDSGSPEFTIMSKENAFKLTINSNVFSEQVARFSIFDGFKWSTIQSVSSIPEEWTHIAATFDGNTIGIFVNGNQEASLTLDGVPTINSYGYVELQPLESIESDTEILYGAQQHSRIGDVSTLGYFSGYVDEAVIDNHKLSPFEISDLCTQSQYFSE